MGAEGSRKPTREELVSKTPGIRLGMPIEALTDARAARRRITSREELSHFLVIDEVKFADYLESKPLVSDESRSASWIPHYHPVTGVVYTTRWITPPSEIVDGKQRLVPKAGEVFKVLRPCDGKIDLNSLPVSATSAKLIPMELKSIESALRQQDEVAHDYFIKGPEFGKIEELSAAIRSLSIQFILDHPRLDSDFEELQGQMGEFFARHGMEKSRDRIWQKVHNQILMAARRDSLGRPNPMVSRVRLGSALLGTVTREVVVGLARDKSSRVYAHLFAEREVERDSLDWAATEIMETQRQIRKHLQMNSGRLSADRITDLRGGFKTIDGILSLVRVAPYLESASLVRQFVASDQFRKRHENDLINARLKAHHWENTFEFVQGTCAEEYLMKNEPQNAIRTLETSHLLIEDCLASPGNFDITIFDK
jgi:hypothetical protein